MRSHCAQPTKAIYEWDIETGRLYISDTSKFVFWSKAASLTTAVWNERIHPDDYEGYRGALTAHFKGSRRNSSTNTASTTAAAIPVGPRSRHSSTRRGWTCDPSRRRGERCHRAQAVRGEMREAHEETSAALERQTAMAEILKVMASSPSDVQPVFDAIASGATRLCDASFSVVFRYDGSIITVAADDGRSPGTLDVIRSAYPRHPARAASPDARFLSGG
jgi:hypothetical protein